MTTTQILSWSGGKASACDPAREVAGVSTDTRTLKPGEVYLALRGQNFDGHDFLPQALAAGAAAVIVSKAVDVPADTLVITVRDTLQALKDISRGYRRFLGAKVVAVAGSNGKTTVKDMTAAMLARRYQVSKTPRNNNNRIGVSLTLLSARPGDHFIVCELGTNAPGEIAELTAICEPDASILTNINEEHLEHLGDIEGVFDEESMALELLTADALAVLPADDRYCERLRQKCHARVLTAGFDSRADFQVTEWKTDPKSQIFKITNKTTGDCAEFRLPLPGRHMAANAVLAAAFCASVGVCLDECAKALADFSPEKGRLRIHCTPRYTIIDDTYNANPASMIQALRVLESYEGRKVAILGDMGELGVRSVEIHTELGQHIAASNADVVIGVGVLAANYRHCGKEFHHYSDSNDAAENITKHTRVGDAILVKGSRFMKMETIVQALMN